MTSQTANEQRPSFRDAAILIQGENPAVHGGRGCHVGCNVENAAYTPTTHAEQNAVTIAVANGETEFVQLALVSDGENGVPPCGFCRQVLREFCADEFLIHVGTPDGFETYTLGEILPESFGPEDLEQAEVSQSH